MNPIVEWELTMKCNYSCQYCTNLDKKLRPNLDEDTLRAFIKSLGEKYPGIEIFVFGGEPFVHPKINFILKCFNEYNIPFVVQTNYSRHSIEVMKTIEEPFKINISIHPTEIGIEDIPKLFMFKPNINVIDVMYSGKEAIQYYLAVKKVCNIEQIFLTPVTDFGDGLSDTLLAEYLELTKHSIYSKIIKFEEVERFGRPRSEIWLDPTFTTKGKPCLYKDKYFLYGPTLELYNCCYRLKTDGICPKNKCFLM